LVVPKLFEVPGTPLISKTLIISLVLLKIGGCHGTTRTIFQLIYKK